MPSLTGYLGMMAIEGVQKVQGMYDRQGHLHRPQSSERATQPIG